MDKISPERRSLNMAAIRSSNTSIELMVRRALFAQGFRFKKNFRGLPGTPDIVFSKKRIVIFLDGCFWHGHLGCLDCHIPKTNSKFWQSKITKNIERDLKNRSALREMGYIVLQYWECEIRNKLYNVINEIKIKLTSKDYD